MKKTTSRRNFVCGPPAFEALAADDQQSYQTADLADQSNLPQPPINNRRVHKLKLPQEDRSAFTDQQANDQNPQSPQQCGGFYAEDMGASPKTAEKVLGRRRAEHHKEIVYASFYRDRAIRHCLKFEYFDCLTQAQKCSQLLRITDSEKRHRRLVELKATQPKAYYIMLDCYLYSSISYIQLKQNTQAVTLTSEIIQCQPDDYARRYQNCNCRQDSAAEGLDDEAFECNPVFMQALVLRAKGFEKLGVLDRALEDISAARNIDKSNQVIESAYRSIKEKQAESNQVILTPTTTSRRRTRLSKPRTRTHSFASDEENLSEESDEELLDLSAEAEEDALTHARQKSSNQSDSEENENLHEILLINNSHPSSVRKMKKLTKLRKQSKGSFIRMHQEASRSSPQKKTRVAPTPQAITMTQKEACLAYLQSLGLKNRHLNNILQLLLFYVLSLAKRVRKSRRVQFAMFAFLTCYCYMLVRVAKYMKGALGQCQLKVQLGNIFGFGGPAKKKALHFF